MRIKASVIRIKKKNYVLQHHKCILHSVKLSEVKKYAYLKKSRIQY